MELKKEITLNEFEIELLIPALQYYIDILDEKFKEYRLIRVPKYFKDRYMPIDQAFSGLEDLHKYASRLLIDMEKSISSD